MRTSVIWFRNDLRLHDNITLSRAINESDQVIPVYVFDPRHYRTSTYGFKKTGPFRTQFLNESVSDLHNNLVAKGSGLIVLQGIAEEVLPGLCMQYGAEALYYSKEVAPDEVREERTLAQQLYECGVEVIACCNDTLIDRPQLPFSVQAMPDMFTAFRWKVEETACVFGKPLPAPASVPTPLLANKGQLPSVAALCGQTPPADPRNAFAFAGGETVALARLQYYLWEGGHAATYFQTRNQLTGANGSTRLSPWLAAGCISPRTIFSEVKKFEEQHTKNKSTYWIGFELLWRDFFRLNMEKYKCELFFTRGPKRRYIRYSGSNDAFLKWCRGQTGVPLIDACMHELNSTGYLSNRGRQVAASFLVNDLNVNWLIGAAYFESLLIDYDVCSNYGNWAYIAGVGNDPRDNRYFNIDKQAAMYDADGTYRQLWGKQHVHET